MGIASSWRIYNFLYLTYMASLTGLLTLAKKRANKNQVKNNLWKQNEVTTLTSCMEKNQEVVTFFGFFKEKQVESWKCSSSFKNKYSKKFSYVMVRLLYLTLTVFYCCRQDGLHIYLFYIELLVMFIFILALNADYFLR